MCSGGFEVIRSNRGSLGAGALYPHFYLVDQHGRARVDVYGDAPVAMGEIFDFGCHPAARNNRRVSEAACTSRSTRLCSRSTVVGADVGAQLVALEAEVRQHVRAQLVVGLHGSRHRYSHSQAGKQ